MFDFLSSLAGPLTSLLGGGNTSSSGGSRGSVQNSNPLNSIFQTFSPIIKPLAGAAGTALGTYFGGPLGGMLGGTLGDTVGSMFGGNEQQKPQQGQQPQQFGPQQSYGNQFGTAMGNAMNQGFNQYIPQELQGQNFSNMGGALGGYLGGQFGHPNAGAAIGGLFNPYIQQRIPESMRNERIGNFGGYLGQQAGQGFDQAMQSGNPFGWARKQASGIPNMLGTSASGFNPFRSPRKQVAIGPKFNPFAPTFQPQNNSIPEAPPFDLDMGNQGGDNFSNGGYGNIPEAPPFDLNMNQGVYDGGIPEAPAFDLDMNLPHNMSHKPIAPDFVQRPSNRAGLARPMTPIEEMNQRFSSGSSNGLRPVTSDISVKGGFKRPPSTPIEEMNQRFSGDHGIRSGARLGLRPSQTRPSNAFPVIQSPHDNLMNEIRNYRRPIGSQDYQRGNYA